MLIAKKTSRDRLPNAIQALRHATQAQHLQLEQVLPLSRLVTLVGYTDVLQRMGTLYQGLETRLQKYSQAFEKVGLDWQVRCKVPLLQRDLYVLGAVWPADSTNGLALPSIQTMDEALGCLYVLEGATLGGQLIRREVAQLLGLSPERGLSFFSSYGRQVGPMWKQFCQVLNSSLIAPESVEQAVKSAGATFKLFISVLAEASAARQRDA